MADQPALTRVAVELTAAELAIIREAAGPEPPAAFIRVAALLQAQVLAAGERPPEARDGARDAIAGDAPSAPPAAPQATPVASDAARLDRLERQLGELLAWVKALACELYGHTGFRDAAHEAEWRRRATERFQRKQQEITAWLDGDSR